MSTFKRGPGNVDDLLATTLDDYKNELVEQWLSGIPFTKKIMQSENKDMVSGGNDLVESVDFQDNDTAGFVSGTDIVGTAINQTFTQAKFVWALLAGTVGILDTELGQNTGKNQLRNLLKARVNNLTNTFKENLENAFGAASTPNANTVWALADIVNSSDPTLANFGDIDRDDNTWWQSTQTASGSMATQGLEDIRTAYYTTSRGQIDPVNMLLTTQTVYEAYQARLQPQEQLQRSDGGDLEFDHLAFLACPDSNPRCISAC